MTVTQSLRIVAIAFAAMFLAAPVWSQQQQPDQDDEGPGRGVARISLMNGDVSVKRGDTGDFVAAAINAPLMVSDRVLTGNGSRAEVQFDSANLLRMSGGSEIRLSELEWQRYMVQIAAGTVTFRVIRNSEAQVELNTPTVAIRPVKKGEYRISVHEDGTTEITVRSGELDIVTPRGSERLKAGHTMLARTVNGEAEFQVNNAPGRDAFDMWNQERDKYFERSQAYDRVSPDIYGAEDLDANGAWTNSPQYGRVWVPRVEPGWAPYRDGRWVYYDWYGWTWVSNDPWGWAPYHYGRWFFDASFGGWGWWPGAPGHRQYWRPAYVSFFGWGGNGGGVQVGVGFGFGNVGWVPLAPYEPCYGWWGRNRYNGFRTGVYNQTTIVNNVSITNIYRNARVANGITSVSVNDFGRTRVHNGNVIRTRATDLHGAGMVRGNLPVAPERGVSTRLSDREVRYTGNSRLNADNARVYRTREPARVDRVSFEDQRRGTQEIARRSMANMGGGGGGGAVADNGSRPNPAPAANGNGWRRVGEGTSSANGQPSSSRSGGESRQQGPGGGGSGTNGWRRFGESQGQTQQQQQHGGGSVGPQRNSTRDENNVGWQRFGNSNRPNSNSGLTRQRGEVPQPQPQQPVQQQQQQQRQRPDSSAAPQFERRQQQPQQDSPRYQRQQQQPQQQAQPRVERQLQTQPARSSEPVRISPPIVHRSNDGSRGNGGDGGGGGGHRGGGSGSSGGESRKK